MKKVSVIIPVYKVEAYLEECIDSLLSQTYENIEFIFVNDCSPDGSRAIIERYLINDTRIRLIDAERNLGMAGARNLGLKSATGFYLAFCDSDDIMVDRCIEILVGALEKSRADIAIAPIYCYNETKGFYYADGYYNNAPMKKYIGKGAWDPKILLWYMPNVNVSPCAKLFKKDLVDGAGVGFPDGLAFEDNIFFFHYIFLPKVTAVVLEEPLYFYRSVRIGGVTSSPPWAKDVFPVGELLMNLLKRYGLENEGRPGWELWIICSFFYWMKGRGDSAPRYDFFLASRATLRKLTNPRVDAVQKKALDRLIRYPKLSFFMALLDYRHEMTKLILELDQNLVAHYIGRLFFMFYRIIAYFIRSIRRAIR